MDINELLGDYIPAYRNYGGAARQNISVLPEDHERFSALAKQLQVNRRVLLVTLINYVEDQLDADNPS